jgi:hypothetical protein
VHNSVLSTAVSKICVISKSYLDPSMPSHTKELC